MKASAGSEGDKENANILSSAEMLGWTSTQWKGK